VLVGAFSCGSNCFLVGFFFKPPFTDANLSFTFKAGACFSFNALYAFCFFVYDDKGVTLLVLPFKAFENISYFPLKIIRISPSARWTSTNLPWAGWNRY